MANNVVNRFRDFMVNKVLDVKSHFQDWDRHNSQKISPKQFRQVLASFKFYMTDEELAAIHQRFNDGNFIKYLDFI